MKDVLLSVFVQRYPGHAEAPGTHRHRGWWSPSLLWQEQRRQPWDRMTWHSERADTAPDGTTEQTQRIIPTWRITGHMLHLKQSRRAQRLDGRRSCRWRDSRNDGLWWDSASGRLLLRSRRSGSRGRVEDTDGWKSDGHVTLTLK